MLKSLITLFVFAVTASCFAATTSPQFTLIMDASGKYPQMLQFLKNQQSSKSGLAVGTILLDVQNPASDSDDFGINTQCQQGQLSACGKAIQFLAQLQAQNPSIQVYAMVDVSNKYTTSWHTFQPAVQWVMNANKALTAVKTFNGKPWTAKLFFTGIVYDKQSNGIKTKLADWATQMHQYMQPDPKLKTLGLIGAYSLIGDALTSASIDKYYLEMYSITKKLASPQDKNKVYTYVDTVATEETTLQPGGAKKYTTCLGDLGTLPGEKTPPLLAHLKMTALYYTARHLPNICTPMWLTHSIHRQSKPTQRHLTKHSYPPPTRLKIMAKISCTCSTVLIRAST